MYSLKEISSRHPCHTRYLQDSKLYTHLCKTCSLCFSSAWLWFEGLVCLFPPGHALSPPGGSLRRDCCAGIYMYMYTSTHTHRKEPRHQTVAPNTHRILDATIMLPVPLNSEDLVRTAPLKATIATLYQKYTKVASLVSYFLCATQAYLIFWHTRRWLVSSATFCVQHRLTSSFGIPE
jgi:hypothetical protein